MTQDHQVLTLRLAPTGTRERYQVEVLDAGGRLAQGEFTLRPADLAARLAPWTQRERREWALRQEPDEARTTPALRQVGTWLWQSVLGGEVGRALSERLKAAQESGRALRLELHIAPDAPELMALPWEALYDPEQQSFLTLSRLISLVRVPHDLVPGQPPEIRRPLRLLVVISSPPDLPEEERLDTAGERRTIEGALRRLTESGLMEVDFCDEAAQEVLQKMLLARDYHLVHYTGHGGFDPTADNGRGDGYLVMEDGHDHTRRVYSADVARLFAGTPLRLMVLSGCLTAQVSRESALSGVAGALLKAGLPAVVAMPAPIADRAATDWADLFYTALAAGRTVDAAMSEARLHLYEAGHPDWPIPALFLRVPPEALFKVSEAPAEVKEEKAGLSLVDLPTAEGSFVGRQMELRRIERALTRPERDRRLVLITGMGGMGKSTLAARAAQRCAPSFAAAYAVKCESAPPLEQILIELGAFLTANGDQTFDQTLRTDAPLRLKLAALVQALEKGPYLIIFDNFESLLDDNLRVADEGVRGLLETLLNSLRRSRVMVTCRFDFEFTRDRKSQGRIERVALDDLTVREAFWLMGHMPHLSQARPDQQAQLYDKARGNPYVYDLLEAAARSRPLADIVVDLRGVAAEMVQFALLDELYGSLSPDAQQLVVRAAVFRRPVLIDGLEALLGRAVGAEVEALVARSLLTRRDSRYAMHPIARDHFWGKLTGAEQRATRLQAAAYYLQRLPLSHDLADALEARQMYFEAEEFDDAGRIVRNITEILYRWGLLDLARELNVQTIETTTGETKAAAYHHLAMVEQAQGHYAEALSLYQQSLAIEEELGNRAGIAQTLHQLAMLQQDQGHYAEALSLYQQSLEIAEELGDRAGIATTCGQLGILNRTLKNYRGAIRYFAVAYTIFEQLGSPYKDLAGRHLAEVREEIGEEEFTRLLGEVVEEGARG